MRTFLVLVLMQVPLILLGQTIEPEQRMVQGDHGKLFTQAYKSKDFGRDPRLLVVLHGDAPRNKPGYHYRFAERAADAHTNLVAVGLLRPGYTDPVGNRSEGKRGNAVGDNWHGGNTDTIAAVIAQLAKDYGAGRVIVAGHSGGAALSANILGRHPKLINAALLVALPADLEAWRKHMLGHTKSQIFGKPINSLSAIDLLPKVDPATQIHLIVGEKDRITPLWLSRRYHEQAVKHGKQVEMTVLPEKGHEVFLHPAVFEKLATLLAP
ncbi:alpha/beta hydrolase family protein [Acanthopleuribacter pedis]|uniref:Prolyl oligopeptidase family serine peptidase n=1 Tax=Acanthopleuribacter pedis TaxID=442870 RepID=A0A8J7Q7G0_9BACT|nr:alpha/beta fold hydrolase [Acanthopleuribacter pedis]MBO1318729.1 prolyl oligopeptidase family serine peptidase [Acanthopleuribacter pedis]